MTAPIAQPGTLYRAAMKFERDFTQLPNQWLRDERLSRGARGILGELMTHQAGFSISIAGLVDRGREGKDAVRRMVSELEACGYLRREKQTRQAGQFGGMRWTLMDPWEALVQPPTVGGFPADGSAADGSAADGSAVSGEPATKNTNPRTDINQDFPEQPSVVVPVPVDNSVRWQTPTCPAAWKGDRAHMLGDRSGKCINCAETPLTKRAGA